MKTHTKKIFKLFTSHKQNSDAKEAFHKWLVNEEHTEEKDNELLEIWNQSSSEPNNDTWTALFRFKEYLRINKQKKTLRIWQSVAAVFVLISGGLISLLTTSQKNTATTDLIEAYTPIAQLHVITLPDGTTVHTNAKTTLLYPEEFTGKTRSVYLIGEATFNVAQDKEHPFIVKTSDINVTALGTEFNVAAYPEDSIIYTTLLSGSIEVVDNTTNLKKTLIPNELLAYNKTENNAGVSIVDPSIITSWRDNVITIQNKTLKEIFSVLERNYIVKFNYSMEAINKDYRYTFKFKRNSPIEEIVRVIKTVSKINYKIEESTCYIY